MNAPQEWPAGYCPGQRNWDITIGVGLTALGVAAARAAETTRADRLVADPYAAMLVEAAGPPVPLPTRLPEPAPGAGGSVERDDEPDGDPHPVFDDYLTHATHEDGVRQVVVLAAGLDTRAHRLDWPASTGVFEIDHPNVLAFKDQMLARQQAGPRCDRHRAGIDLRDDWPAALTKVGFDHEQPTAWLAEGLLPYLPETAERALFTHLHRLSRPGSRLAAHDSRDITALRRDMRLWRLAGCFGIDPTGWFHSEPTRPDPRCWFTTQGWLVDDTSTAGELAGRYRRQLPAGYADLFSGRSYYLTARLPAQNTEGGP